MMTNRPTAVSGADPASKGELSEIKKSGCVLIVYGDQAMRDLLKNYLEEHGMFAIAVSNLAGLPFIITLRLPSLASFFWICREIGKMAWTLERFARVRTCQS
jgi:hypothetical protein